VEIELEVELVEIGVLELIVGLAEVVVLGVTVGLPALEASSVQP